MERLSSPEAERVDQYSCRGLDWKKGDRIVTTLLEHHSRSPALDEAEEDGDRLEVIAPDRGGRIDLADFERAIKQEEKGMSP